uniref:Uncharacterized protein n=1 Tax=Erpetoichthys calabaricus TaxID=27687 RepID=A0A8C4T383_ERPCA
PNIVKKFNDSSCLCVVNTVSKLTKMCTLRLTKEKLFFMLTDKVANGGVSMWSELLQENFFDEFQIEASVELSQHDIPVELISRRLWNDFREPVFEENLICTLIYVKIIFFKYLSLFN